MSDESKPSISIGGNVGGPVVVGDENVTTTTLDGTEPEAVDTGADRESGEADGRIFISHASADAELVEELLDLLELGADADRDQLFCSSLPGTGIPPGVNYVETLRQELRAARLAILLISPNFKKSSFCLCELGAVWAMGTPQFPLLVPPLTSASLDEVLSAVQAFSIDDPAGLDLLRDHVADALGITGSTPRWTRRRDRFLTHLPSATAS